MKKVNFFKNLAITAFIISGIILNVGLTSTSDASSAFKDNFDVTCTYGEGGKLTGAKCETGGSSSCFCKSNVTHKM